MPDEIRDDQVELDPNSNEGFNQRLAQKVGRELSSEQLDELSGSDRDIQSGLTYEESPRPRDDQGRFLPKEPVAEEEAGGAAPEAEQVEELTVEEPEEPQVDPAVQQWLEQHGDPNAAIAAALKEREEAQSLIGRQSGEVGQLRRELDEMRGYLQGREQSAPQGPVVQVSRDEIEQMIVERGGQTALAYVAQSRPDLIEPTIALWGEYEPFAAAAARQDYKDHLAQSEREQVPVQQESPHQQEIQAMVFERQMGSLIDKTRQTMPDAEWKALGPHLAAEMDNASQNELIMEPLVSGDPTRAEQAFGAMVRLAKLRAYEDATARVRAEEQTKVNAQKQSTQVASGSLRPVQERQPTSPAEMTSDERIAAFKEAFRAANTTSVADGLTFDK